jgi:hypothetical protein
MIGGPVGTSSDIASRNGFSDVVMKECAKKFFIRAGPRGFMLISVL